MKKIAVLLMVVVLVLGFAACDKQPAVGTPVSITDHTPVKELWRGIVVGEVETYGPWGIIHVESPKDNNDYLFSMVVIFREYGPAVNILPHKIRVGTENYFSRHHVSSTDFSSGGGRCEIGIFHASDDNLFAFKNAIVMNPPRKK